jgi:hypothetical protein
MDGAAHHEIDLDFDFDAFASFGPAADHNSFTLWLAEFVDLTKG